MRMLIDWLDSRTGCRQLCREALFENIPGGARWRYVWGSTLVFTLLIQFITGMALWMAYSPSAQTAWESVYFIQYEMAGGWFLRGLHHYTAQVMQVLLILHLMQILIDGAYKAPREINFWFGVLLLLLIMGLSLTGYLLPWDQKGFWATQVATNIAGITPVIGPDIQRLLIGGAGYGHHTLTRFFAIHAGVLPAMIVALVIGHIYLFRRHGITPKKPLKRPNGLFWPDQVLRDSVACLAVLAAIILLIFINGGAHLGAPADPSEPYSAARPEWYFLFLFQFLKYFPGGLELWGAIYIPTILLGIIFLMPFIGKWRRGHAFNIVLAWFLLAAVAVLTWLALAEDRANPTYIAAVKEAEENAERAKVLSRSDTGIPAEGAASLLRNDPFVQGPQLFAMNCASCHTYDGHNGRGILPEDEPSAADLHGFATREWIAGLLDPEQVDSLHYFGGSAFKDGEMSRFVKRRISRYSEEEHEKLAEVIMAVSAEAELPGQKEIDERDIEAIERGRQHLLRGDAIWCIDCHRYREKGELGDAPDLTGYGSHEWLAGIITNPEHERFYGETNDRMPAFGVDRTLSPREIDILANWLRGDWYEEE